MKKNIIYFLSLIFIIFLGIGGYIITKKYNITKNLTTKNNTINKINNDNNIVKAQNKENTKNNKIVTTKTKEKNNISIFKKKLKAKGLIIRGDIQLKHKQYLFALQKFIHANKQTPNNPKIIGKIAKSYFLMQNFANALRYYNKLKNLTTLDTEQKENKVLSYLYSQNIEDNNFKYNASGSLDNNGTLLINNVQKTIKTFDLDNENKFYYTNTLECIISFHKCKLNFENYFKNTAYSGKNEKLEVIRKTIENYTNLQLDELYYKNALLIGAFLQNKNYPTAIILGKNLLKEKQNYKPILKIIAQSYYNLNKEKLAKEFLIKYTRIDTSDSDVSYMLGAINQKQHNYIQSNIFLDIAIKQGYYDIESIYRLKLYNYLLLDQKEKINSTFDKIIISQKIPNFNDLVLASYYNIIAKKFTKALLYIKKGIKLYPEKEDFYGLKAWIYIEENKLDEAEKLLKKAQEIHPRNAVIVLNIGRIDFERYKQTKKAIHKIRAKIFFQKTMELDNTEIGSLAQHYLQELKSIEK